MTLRKQIVAAIITKLNTSTPVGVPQAIPYHLLKLEPAALPSICVYSTEEEVEAQPRPAVQPVLAKRTLRVVVECREKADIGTSVDDAVDPLCAWVVKALGGQTQAGLYHVITEDRTDVERSISDHGYIVVTITFRVSYQTKAGDAEAWA